MTRHKVLMLGWEYPPIINGGLGIASLGLSKALSEYTDLTMILPKSDKNFVVKNVELIGLNNLDIEKSLDPEITKTYLELAHVREIEMSIFPYEGEQKILTKEVTKEIIEEEHKSESKTVKTNKIEEDISPLDLFKDEDIYANDIVGKVILYSKYAQKLAKDIDFDVIHAHDWMTFLAGIDIKNKYNKPLVLHVHSLDYDRVGEDHKSWIFDLERSAMEKADLIIPVSKYTGRVIANHYGLPESKIFPVHNGLEPTEVFKTPKKFPEKLVLFLGRITGQKGPEYFLDIASKVFEKFPNVRFVVAGTGDKLRRMIEAGAYRQLGHRFHFTGFLDREKVRELLSMADVYCMPSVSEPFGLTALEAVQFGVPVVISERSGVAEVLRGALKADFWDVDLMAQHIINILSDSQLKKQVILQGYEDLQNLSWENAAKKVLFAYDKVSKNGKLKSVSSRKIKKSKHP